MLFRLWSSGRHQTCPYGEETVGLVFFFLKRYFVNWLWMNATGTSRLWTFNPHKSKQVGLFFDVTFRIPQRSVVEWMAVIIST